VGGGTVESIPVGDGQIVVSLRLPAGQRRISLALVEPVGTGSADAGLNNFQWQFEPLAP